MQIENNRNLMLKAMHLKDHDDMLNIHRRSSQVQDKTAQINQHSKPVPSSQSHFKTLTSSWFWMTSFGATVFHC
jgi:hypothetical protein